MLSSVHPGLWVEAVLAVVFALAYLAWLLRRHRVSRRVDAIILEVCVVVILLLGIYFLVVRAEQ